MYIGLSS